MSRYGEKPKSVRRVGLAGSNCVRFEATVLHGRGTRRIDVDIHARDILAMADAIRATAGQACQDPRHRTGHPADAWSVGHAIWHLDNQNRPMPCIVGDIIDMDALPGETTRTPVAAQGSVDLPAEAGEASASAASVADDETSIEELVLSIRATTILAQMGIRTVGELTVTTAAELRANDASELVVLAIQRALAQVGRSLAPAVRR